MGKRTVLILIFWCEVVICARSLLFTVPVLIHNNIINKIDSMGATEWFMTVVTLSAVTFFIAGLSGIIQQRIWKLIHYISLILVGVLTFGFMKHMSQSGTAMELMHFIPAAAAAAAVFLVTVLSLNAKTA